MKNFLSLDLLEDKEVMNLILDALAFKRGMTYDLRKKTIANMFFESSTRTQYSFNIAEERLGMKVISFNAGASSLNKGETFYDTVKTFSSFGVDALVIRHPNNRYYDELKEISSCIINAGDGTGDHPSQSLLDLVTIYEEFGRFEGIKIAIVGDISHSRVAHGNIKIMKRLNMETYISGPKCFNDDTASYIDFDDAVKTMDVIMMLRIQNERSAKIDMTNEEYNCLYGLNKKRVEQMKETAIIMHPAPFNRGVEISSDVVEHSKSRIFKQMTNGVYARESILKWCFS